VFCRVSVILTAILFVSLQQRPVYHVKHGDTTVDMVKLKPDGKIANRDDFSAQSSTVRLSCPHLIQAIDHFEYDGRGIERINAGLNQYADDEVTEVADVVEERERITHTGKRSTVKSENLLSSSAQAMRQHFREVGETWHNFKEAVVSESDRVVLKHKLGEEGTKHFLSSGPGGISRDVLGDVKCLHVHVADALVRGEEANKFGRWTLRKLKDEYNIEKDGCSSKLYCARAGAICVATRSLSLLTICFPLSQSVGSNVTGISSAQ
jgi:hypothetical protein